MLLEWQVGEQTYPIPEEKIRSVFSQPLRLSRVREIFNGTNDNDDLMWRTRFALAIAKIAADKLELGIKEETFETKEGPTKEGPIYAHALIKILETLNPPLFINDLD